MNYMETINEMQALVTKLRREVQRGEAPKKGKCILCGFKHPKIHPAFGTGVPKDVKDKLFKYPIHPETAGECPCKSEDFPREDCPLHGWIIIFKGQKAAYDRLHNPPDLPLHVRVAKALGHHTENDLLMYVEPRPSESYCGESIPDYPNDLVAAMGALKEYFKQDKPRPIITYLADDGYEGYRWLIEMEGRKPVVSTNLPQAICEAIVAHAEGK